MVLIQLGIRFDNVTVIKVIYKDSFQSMHDFRAGKVADNLKDSLPTSLACRWWTK